MRSVRRHIAATASAGSGKLPGLRVVLLVVIEGVGIGLALLGRRRRLYRLPLDVKRHAHVGTKLRLRLRPALGDGALAAGKRLLLLRRFRRLMAIGRRPIRLRQRKPLAFKGEHFAGAIVTGYLGVFDGLFKAGID